MIMPDVNVLIHAFRKDSAEHAVCKPWLESVAHGDSQFGLSPLALSAVVRITTTPRIFREPSSLEEAFAYCDALLDRPTAEIVRPGERHWSIFRNLCIGTGTRGARAADAWFAALAIEHGCTWISYDRDYARFPGLDWKLPGT